MITHIALFYFKTPADNPQTDSRYKKMAENGEILRKLPSVHSYILAYLTPRTAQAPGTADLAVTVQCLTWQDFQKYIATPEHSSSAAYGASVCSHVDSITYEDSTVLISGGTL